MLFQVRIGSLDDPDDLPGLAHFTEHMLFYASEKYPSEDEYSKFVVSFPSLQHIYIICIVFVVELTHSCLFWRQCTVHDGPLLVFLLRFLSNAQVPHFLVAAES